MFEKEAEEYLDTESKYLIEDNEGNIINITKKVRQTFKDGAEFGYNKANEWHYVKDGDLPRQDEHTCFSIAVLADSKKWVYYCFTSGKWFCRDKEIKVNAWKEIVLPEENE